MSYLDKKEDILASNYIKRYEAGTLDIRFPGYVSKRLIKRIYRAFESRRMEVELETYCPVLVYKLNNKYYIYDGKHRAALCAYMNKNIKCIEIDRLPIKKELLKKMYKMMLSDSNEYQRNISFISTLMITN